MDWKTWTSGISGIALVPIILFAVSTQRDEQSISQIELSSNQKVIQYKIGDRDYKNWTITPELKPDTLYVGCTDTKYTIVEFVTDVERRTFRLKGRQSEFFNIALTDTIIAETAIQCIPPKRRYIGDYTPERSTAGRYAEDLSPLMSTYTPDHGAGAILSIWQAGAPLFDQGFGFANIDNLQRRTTAQHFDIASVSKEFVVVSILQLIESGALSMSDPVANYFPKLRRTEGITIEHLLRHTHGLPHYFMHGDYDREVELTLDAAIKMLNAQELRFPAGENLEYGNTGCFLAAKIVEEVSGLDYESYVREYLLRPAGMTRTGFYHADYDKLNPVPAYVEREGQFTIDGPNYHPSHMTGVGDILTTAGDLRRWHKSVSNGGVLSEEMFAVAAMATKLPDGGVRARGLGFMVGEHDGRRFIYNSGDNHTHTRYAYFPDEDLSIIFNTNNSVEHEWNQSSIIFAQI